MALVASDTVCLPISLGRGRRMAIWMSLEVMEACWLERARHKAPLAMHSKMSFMNKSMMFRASCNRF